jgi:hypothetical protein
MKAALSIGASSVEAGLLAATGEYPVGESVMTEAWAYRCPPATLGCLSV